MSWLPQKTETGNHLKGSIMLHISAPLLAWFYENRRSLPFRDDPTPYHIWVSEVMLQQTRMSAVLPYYARFMEEYPTPAALAASDPDRLHRIWEGLGYYSRADNLRRAAIVITEQYGGDLPRTYEELLALPGIGEYTAGAIASISMNIPAPAVDGNVLRVFSRLYNDRADILHPYTKRRVTAQVMEEMPSDTPGDFNQALMELGALVCVPGQPQCDNCPLRHLCGAAAAGTAAALPFRAPKKPRRVEEITVLLIRSEAGWLLTKREEKGLLAGLWQPLTLTDFSSGTAEAALAAIFPEAEIRNAQPLAPSKHLFTHIEWRMSGWLIELAGTPQTPENCVWAAPGDMDSYAIPSAFRAYKKILR